MLGRKRNVAVTDSNVDKKKKERTRSSKVEQNIIKRIQKYRDVEKEEQLQKSIKENIKTKEKDAYDLWAVEKPEPKKGTQNEIMYPKVPLPHPGQSYNPSKKDLKHLLSKVVEHNRPLELEPESTMKNEIKPFEEEDENEEVDPNEKISNNPPVMSQDKLSRTERNKLVIITYSNKQL